MIRVSTSYQYGSYSANIDAAQQRYLNLQNQIGSGKKLFRPSDDPVGTASSLSIRSLQSAADRYRKNIAHGSDLLKSSESAFEDIHALLQRSYQLAVQGANAATDQSGREAMVTEVTEIQRRLLESANARGPNDEFLFAGQKVDVKPFTTTGSTLTYNGDANPLVVETGPGETSQANVNATQMITDAYDRLESLKNNLTGGNVGAISGVDIQQLQNSLATFNVERGKIGSRLQQFEQLDSDFQRRIDDLTKGLSDVEDVDMAQAIMDYQLAQTAYTAALNVASQGFRLNLMDFLRG